MAVTSLTPGPAMKPAPLAQVRENTAITSASCRPTWWLAGEGRCRPRATALPLSGAVEATHEQSGGSWAENTPESAPQGEGGQGVRRVIEGIVTVMGLATYSRSRSA